MNSYTFDITCRRCGGELTPAAAGKPTGLGAEVRATCECESCGARWLVFVQMSATYLPSASPEDRARQLGFARLEKQAAHRLAEFARSLDEAGVA